MQTTEGRATHQASVILRSMVLDELEGEMKQVVEVIGDSVRYGCDVKF